jgi:hypothetical protein
MSAKNVDEIDCSFTSNFFVFATLLLTQFGFVIFWQTNTIGSKVAHKMLLKLTTGWIAKEIRLNSSGLPVTESL